MIPTPSLDLNAVHRCQEDIEGLSAREGQYEHSFRTEPGTRRQKTMRNHHPPCEHEMFPCVNGYGHAAVFK